MIFENCIEFVVIAVGNKVTIIVDSMYVVTVAPCVLVVVVKCPTSSDVVYDGMVIVVVFGRALGGRTKMHGAVHVAVFIA